MRSWQRHHWRGQPGAQWVKSTTAASHPASASQSHRTPKWAGGSELLGAVRDSGRAKRCSCLGYVTSVRPLWFPQRAKPSHLWICKSAQRSSLRLCACKKGSTLWSRGYKHNIEYQMAFLMLAGASRHFQRLQPVEDLMKFCKQSPSHLAAFFAVFQSWPTAVTWKSLPPFQGFTWSL